MTTADERLDETIDETFPASDAPANTVGTGARAGAGGATVRDNHEASRFELEIGGELAVLEYERRPQAIVLAHTEVPPSFRGRGIGSALVKAALERARAEHASVIARCPFVRAYLRAHRTLT